MAEAVISDEINRHVEAVVVLSKRDILLRLLREAELCIDLEQVGTAAILAGVALEEVYLFSDASVLRQHGPSFEVWRELRNRASHPAVGSEEINREAVAAMVTEIRTLLDEIDPPQSRRRWSPRLENEITKIRGKYTAVPTSVDDFLKRKRQDLELENRE